MNKTHDSVVAVVYKDHSEKYSMNFFISYIIMTGQPRIYYNMEFIVEKKYFSIPTREKI